MKRKKRRWLVWLILLLLLLAVAGGIFWWMRSRSPELETYQAEIDRAITSQEYEQALSLCNQALQEYPREGILYSRKAEIYQAKGETDLAVRTLDYGYKQTGWPDLLEQRDTYDDTVEPDVEFTPARVAAPELLEEEPEEQEDPEGGDGADFEAPEDLPGETDLYIPYELPQISLPHVDPPSPAQDAEDSEKEEPDGEDPDSDEEDPNGENPDGEGVDEPGEETQDEDASEEEKN